jgi:hypothetical protein
MAGPRSAGAFFMLPGRNMSLARRIVMKMHYVG